ncbi:C40 family peptidase [Aeromicrobium sp. YIM 150415]|uniref:NlpC/P60 family protein n=1 Tax=Aeromicrobium sp. YIM 150415 TaxID=2803912 RepID=UPI0019661997|nr:NlpC/P60 family protein [Aeromicrobium sp. YIM 150415]MBM9462002.1 C40 family peptidase [Aeromicrobium sp. YIM 150415]
MSRRFPLLVVSVVGLVGASMSAVQAAPDEDRVAAIQVELVESRQALNGLYANAAAASEQYNAAVVAAERADSEIAELDGQIAEAEAELETERTSVADLTLRQLEGNDSIQAISSMVGSSEPRELLERAGAFASTQDAVAAQISQLEAKQAVVRTVLDEAERAQQRRDDALAAQRSTVQFIEDTIAEAEQRQGELTGERETLLAELARLQELSVDEVTSRQDRIDERIDSSGPSSVPEGAPGGSGGENTSPSPNRPAPTTEAPRPTQPPPPPPAPKPNPPAPKPPPPPPAPNPTGVEAMIGYAQAQLGKPYQWGGAGPNSFDCSGLVMRALEAAGKGSPRVAGDQYNAFRKIDPSQRQRGDLLFWSNGSGIYHVAISLGGGRMIHAPNSSRPVEIVSDTWMGAPHLAARPF